jgi:threonine dehydrogenase-like Zn-dependent dehydrogenase
MMKALALTAEWDPKPGYPVSAWELETGKAITGNSVWRHPTLEVKEVPSPQVLPDQVLIRIRACGVCGSDMHFYETDADDYILYPGLTRFPSILGHEFSGEVVEVGSDVQDLQVGDRVTAEEMIWCGHCRPCRDGFPNQCQNLEEIGFTIDGAFAEYIAIGAKYCWKLNDLAGRYDDQLLFDAGALVEPCSVAYNCVFTRAGGFLPGGNVVIFGQGPIGLAAAAECKAAGAAKVITFETSPSRRELGLAVGADHAFDPRTVVPHAAILDLTHGYGADLLVEAAGAPDKTVPEMELALAVNGKIAQVGRAATKVPIYLERFQVRHAQFFGSQGHSGNGIFPHVISMMAAGLIDMTRIITARYTLDDAVQAIAASTGRSGGKVMVRMV